MANYPNKPWTDGQTFEVIPGETFVYDASQSVWQHQTKATLDSDFQVDKAALEADIATNASDISGLDTRLTTAEGDISTLQSQVSLLDGMSDSETARIEQNIADIQNAYAMLDSDGAIIQGLRTDLEAEITATNADVTAITARLDSDETALQALQTQVDQLNVDNVVIEADHDSDVARIDADVAALAIPVVSAVQPAGKTGQLWINTNDGKLYYWNDSDTFVTIVTV